MSMMTPGAGSRGAVTVTVHDGRRTRDPERVDPKSGLGEVLARFEAALPFRVGDPITLPDGSRCPVVTVSDRMSLTGAWSQVVSVGDA
jgi:hypothetical protein